MEKEEHITNNLTGIPCSLSAASSDIDGEINLQWEPVSGARYYVIQTMNGKKWKEIDIITRTTYTASGMKRGKEYSFRIAAVSSLGQGGWSEPVSKKSP